MRITSYSYGDQARVQVSAYPAQPPIGTVHLASSAVSVSVDTPAEARAIGAAFEEMARQLEEACAAYNRRQAGDAPEVTP